MANGVEIREARSRSDLRKFRRAPRVAQANDPAFVPRPDIEAKRSLGRKNPYFDHAEAAFFIALDPKGRPVGRISAQLDERAQSDAGAGLRGHFGCFEARDTATLRALLGAAERWLKARGASTMSGPYSLSINEEAGVLVAGDGGPPRILMNHAPGWYAGALEAAGLAAEKDLLAFTFNMNDGLERRAARLAERAHAIPGLVERPLSRRRLRAELRDVVRIFNDAWAGNWGFVPMTEAEAEHMASSLRPVLDPALARIAEIGGDPVAMMIALPDLNEVYADLNGRLLPFGWARLLWRVRVRGLARARVVLMGLRQAYRGDMRSAAIVPLLVARLYAALREGGYRELEMSWVLDDNEATIRLIRQVGGHCYRRYRIYGKAIA